MRILRPKNTAVHPKFRPWKSRGLPVFQVYACNCNPHRTLPEIGQSLEDGLRRRKPTRRR